MDSETWKAALAFAVGAARAVAQSMMQSPPFGSPSASGACAVAQALEARLQLPDPVVLTCNLCLQGLCSAHRPMVAAAVFCEGDFHSLTWHADEVSAGAFIDGVCKGASAYGAGTVQCYVLPADLDALKEEQHADADRVLAMFQAGREY